MDIMGLLGVLGYGSVEEWASDSGYGTDGIGWFDSDGEPVDIETNFVWAMDAAGYSDQVSE